MRRELLYLEDIVKAIERIERYLFQVERDRFFAEELLQDGVVRNLEIIGEAAKNISEETRQRQSQVPWPEIMRMRDRLAHHYFRLDLEIVWETATQNLSALKEAVTTLLKEIENGENS